MHPVTLRVTLAQGSSRAPALGTQSIPGGTPNSCQKFPWCLLRTQIQIWMLACPPGRRIPAVGTINRLLTLTVVRAMPLRLDKVVMSHADVRLWNESRGAIMAMGTVKFFNATKGFGFITPDAGGTEVFVHISAVERSDLPTLVEGQKVQYDVLSDRRTGKEVAENLRSVA
ncbi:Cold shock protein CspA [Pseudomonas fluorescens]|uniref:CspA_4 protein n=2 Tax=Pseudomonas TaxID=286 RepID=A0A0D0TK49_PSEFL|nr:Cold shock protein of CSP family [Pseudomonas synxantha]KIR21265.1 Cold shock protein CspA [Pseudomonas fluorescens]